MVVTRSGMDTLHDGDESGTGEEVSFQSAKQLGSELDTWLQGCGLPKSPKARAVIAPHAGYRYSGRCAAFAFANIDPASIARVFLLGPSHHYYTCKCALSKASIYKTPLGDLPIDMEVYEELRITGKFEDMKIDVDEAEHSMEMHLPYLAKIFHGHPVKVVPILVGALSSDSEAIYGRLLSKYLSDPANFFSVSSDFCHWGLRFNYTYYDKKQDAFKEYLSEYDNTICGRHPIAVFMHMAKNCPTNLKIKFLRYEQSSHCKSMRDSSVSYASAVVTEE
ncbi:hypothetical protein L7F22_007457 [Adiantum nelumboides]|nr:hypothetical protein [Adiantum nelumboides]